MALTGNEVLYVQGVTAGSSLSPVTQQTTTGAIAGLSGNGDTTDIVSTPITTVGNGTLTAAALLGGLVLRSGPVAAFTDTTDTAAAILTAIGTFNSGATFIFIVKNATAYAQTLSGGTGVTVPVTNVIGPFQEGEYFGTIGGTSVSPTIALSHVLTTAISLIPSVVGPVVTALSTNGAGTITAAMINGGIVARTTVAGTVTDTTDTAANIIAGNPGLLGKIGTSFIFIYGNNSTALATITGGTGVTVSGVTVVPYGMAAEYLVTYTAAATLTLVGLGVTNTTATTLPLAGASTGQINLQASAAAAGTLTLPPITGTLAATSGANLAIIDIYRTTGAITANANVVPATITGLSGAVAIGAYEFEAALYCTIASGTAGIAINQVLTTAVLSACNFEAVGFLAAGVATQATVTATSGTVLYTAANQPLLVLIKGSFTVGTAGTFGLQMCQNTSNASNSVVNIGSTMKLTRIA